MTDVFTFDEAKHRYHLNGEAMTGCTTVLGVIAKPALIGWAAKMATDYIREHVEYAIPGEDGGYWAIKPSTVEEAKTAHTKKKEAAAESGTDTHALIETWGSSCIRIGGYDPAVPAVIRPFVEWAMSNNVKFLASERRVYSKTHFTAGTYDLKLELGGRKYIADIKTQKAIYDRTPFAQMAAYQMMEAEMQGGKSDIDGRLIINLKREGTFNPDEDIYLSEHYEDDLKLFMAALEIYRNMNNRFEPLNKYLKRQK